MCSDCLTTYKLSGLRRPACWPSGLCVGCFVAYVAPLCGLVSLSAEGDGACSLGRDIRVIFYLFLVLVSQRLTRVLMRGCEEIEPMRLDEMRFK